MKSYWLSMTRREQSMVMLLAATLLLSLLYFAVLMPLQSYRDEARQALVAAERVYETVFGAVQAVEKTGDTSGASPRVDQSVRLTLSQLARDKGVVINRIQPDTDGILTLWIEGVPASNLYGWLYSLETDFSIAPVKATVQKTGASGLLRAQLQFRESAS